MKLLLNNPDIKQDEKQAYKSLQKLADAVLHFENGVSRTPSLMHIRGQQRIIVRVILRF